MKKKREKKKFIQYQIGYFHIDIAEVSTEEGRLYLFVAVDRTSKFVYTELLEKSGKIQAAQFLRNLIAAVPYKIHRVCGKHNIEHRRTQPAHLWTNGQVERMNKTIKQATVHRYYYENHGQLKEHLQTFINAYNFAKRLKTLKGLTPYEFIINSWKSSPELFSVNPTLYNSGPYIASISHIMGA